MGSQRVNKSIYLNVIFGNCWRGRWGGGGSFEGTLAMLADHSACVTFTALHHCRVENNFFHEFGHMPDIRMLLVGHWTKLVGHFFQRHIRNLLN